MSKDYRKGSKLPSGKESVDRPQRVGGTGSNSKGAARLKIARQVASNKTKPLAIVGLGASAGGLDACSRFFSAMPSDSGMAFVLIQHLDPDHKSEMATLLGRKTTMRVFEAGQGQLVERNCVYLIPPNKAMTLKKGRLWLSVPAEARGRRMAIDHFFRTLATANQERSIGIVLSGTGSDGTLGIQAIKAADGMVIAQDPENAEHGDMPRSAIAGGLVDHVLRVEVMPDALIKYLRHPFFRKVEKDKQTRLLISETQSYLPAVISLISSKTKFCLDSYKQGTLERRVQRRMSMRQITTGEQYIELLKEDTKEVAALLKDLLICVTHFFRDPEAWKVLREEVLRPLIKRKQNKDIIRVWVPSCATGEEAYTLGILLFDELSAANKSCQVQIFASDVNREALAVARTGSFPESIAAMVPAPLLRRYFVNEDNLYRVRKELRDAVVFADQNLLRDAPFSRMDIISCRNFLIYLEPPAQEKVLRLFHYSLNAGGHLFLGSTETANESKGQFDVVSRKWRIYRSNGQNRAKTALSNDLSTVLPQEKGFATRTAQRMPASADNRLTELTRQLVFERYTPACVVVNCKSEILFTCGPTEEYLKQPRGFMQTGILSWMPANLRGRLRTALKKMRTEEQTSITMDIWVKRDVKNQAVRVTFEALKTPRLEDGLILVTFREISLVAPPAKSIAASHTAEDESLIHQLESELASTREDLQSSISQLESANEDLKSNNEEAISTNEELQSSNEELETSKEEMQSLNEELSTVNSQLQMKVGELEVKSNDLNNLLGSTNITTLFLDRRFHVQWFTLPSRQLLHLLPTDIGRPISDLAQRFTGVNLLKDAEEALRTRAPIEMEMRGDDGRWYLRRVMPYRTADGRVDGVVATYVDIHYSKVAVESVRRLATVVRDSNDAVTVQDFDGNILDWNRGAEIMLGYGEHEALRLNAKRLLRRQDRIKWQELIEQIKLGKTVSTSFETKRVCKDGRIIDVWLTFSALLDDVGRPIGIATTKRDITQRNERMRISEDQTRRLHDLAAQLVATDEEERHKLAVELHDNLAQLLHLAKMKLVEVQPSGEEQSLVLEQARKLINDANQAARSLGHQLSPPILHELGLLPALSWLGEEMKRLYNLTVTVDDNKQSRFLDGRMRSILFRALRELLINVAKHAQVRRARIRIRYTSQEVKVTVEDNGVGFDPQIVHTPQQNHGFGLFSIRGRLEYLGGDLKIRSAPGKGTTVTLRMPLTEHRTILSGGTQ